MMKVCFIGHKTIEKSDIVKEILRETVVYLIDKGVTIFIFGSKSAFNFLAWEVVTDLKREFPYIKRIYIRSSYPNLEDSYKAYLLNDYEETYFPEKLKKAGKYTYVERNYEMINLSNFCVFYYNKNYQPQNRNSGTKIAYNYAIKTNKEIINLYN